jgi:hypothetical protein
VTEAQAIKAVETSSYGGLEQLALHIYSKPKEERDLLFKAEPRKQAAMLDLDPAVVTALMSAPAFLALTTRYTAARVNNPLFKAQLYETMAKRMLEDSSVTLPQLVRGDEHLDAVTGISSPDGPRGGVSITINQQFNSYGGRDALGPGVQALDGKGVEEADEVEAYFTPLTSGGLPPSGVYGSGKEAPRTDKPLFLDPEDR